MKIYFHKDKYLLQNEHWKCVLLTKEKGIGFEKRTTSRIEFGLQVGSGTTARAVTSSHQSRNNQSIKSTSNNDNLLKYFLAFQLTFINSSFLFSNSSQVSLNSLIHFSNLCSSSSQVSFNSSSLFVPFIPSAV